VSNERLRSAMAAARIDIDAIASSASVDPKTVQRWLNGRVPHPRHRWKLVDLLGEDETYYWPQVATSARSRAASEAELITLYPQRAYVPPDLWARMFRRAEQSIDVLVYAAVFLHEQQPDLNDRLRELADRGCRIRIALGDPEGTCVQARGREERFGHGIESRCEIALMHYRPLIGHPRVSIHLHDSTLYNSIFRFDDEALINAHVWGANAFAAPVLHVRRLANGHLFNTYMQSFEAVWKESRPAA
jgi:transcriptional regulator with XRE-family HTH domain